MILTSTTDTLPISITQAATPVESGGTGSVKSGSPNVEVFVAWSDNNPRVAGLPTIPRSSSRVITDTRTYSVVPSPGTDVNSSVSFLSAFNADTDDSAVVSLSYTNSAGVTLQLKNVMLLPQETLQYGQSTGFQVIDSSGFIKTSLNQTEEEEADQDLAETQRSQLIDQNELLLTLMRSLVAESRVMNKIAAGINNAGDNPEAMRADECAALSANG